MWLMTICWKRQNWCNDSALWGATQKVCSACKIKLLQYEEADNFIHFLLQYCRVLGVCDYRRGMDWILDLLTTCIHNLKLHFTDHWHTQTSVLKLLQSPPALSCQQLLLREVLQIPTPRSSSQPLVQNSSADNSSNSQAGGHFTPTS
jgi:hypothetical protein